ncbi:MAG: hypothetical protein U0R19_33805 [Bryobacteraceae bacterium]
MRRLLLTFSILLAPLNAEDIVAVVPRAEKIEILTLGQIEKLDDTNALAYFVDTSQGHRRLVQILFQAKIEEGGGLNLNQLQCLDGSRNPVSLTVTQNLIDGVIACGITPLANGKSRDIKIELPGVMFKGATRPVDLSTTASYRTVAALSPKAIPGDREIFIGLEDALKKRLLDDLQSHQSAITVKLMFDPKDSVPDYNLHVAGVRASDKGEPLDTNRQGDFIKISLTGLLPSRPIKYKVVLSIKKSLLSQVLQDTLDPNEEDLTIVVSMTASSTADRDHADFYFDATFTSYVNPFDPSKAESASNNGKRRNVGIFALTYAPKIATWAHGLSGKGAVGWFAVVPYLKADVSTLPLSEADAPTQIADGLDLTYGYYGHDRTAVFNGVVVTAGARHESDRDFKFQTAVGRFMFGPFFRNWEHSRAYRDALAAKNKKPFLLTSYYFRPKVGYEIGDVVRDRPQRLIENINFQDYISRFLATFDMALEFKRQITLSATDTYYYHWGVDRRPQRNYVEAKLDFNAGYLFRRFGFRALSYGFTGKFQRGEQSPSFKPVNVFSIGVTFVR